MATQHYRRSGKVQYSCNFRILSDRLLADDRMTPATKLILMAVQNFGYGEDHCFPAIGTLAKATALSENTVRASLEVLVDLGLIRVEDDPTNRTGKRIVRLWMSDPDIHPVEVSTRESTSKSEPKDALGSKIEPTLGFKNCGTALGAKSEPKRTSLREPSEGISSSSSSDAALAQEEEDCEIDDVVSVAYCIDQATELFRPFDDYAIKVLEGRVRALCRECGDNVTHALWAARDRIKESGSVPWKYVEVAARKMKREGGAVGRSVGRAQLIEFEWKEAERIKAEKIRRQREDQS